jgi:hypothetical protein
MPLLFIGGVILFLALLPIAMILNAIHGDLKIIFEEKK